MVATKLADDAVGFADGNAGHVYTYPAGAPSVGELDVFAVSSATVVSTPSGYSVAKSVVGGQGAYLFYRFAVGGEATTTTITTSGDFNTSVEWSRWSGVTALDVTAESHVDASGGTSTPSVSTGTLGGTNELVIAAGCLHSGDPPTGGFTYSTGYTGFTATPVTQDTSGGGAATAVCSYRTDAGTASESPQISWGAGNVADRYILVATFTTVSTFSRTTSDSVTAADSPARTLTDTRTTADSVTAADTPTQAVSLPRATSDAFTTADSPANNTTLPRGPSDTVTAADSPTRTVTLTRATSDTFTTADSPAQAASLPRATADGFTIADTLTRVLTLPRAVADTLTVTDVAAQTAARTLTLNTGGAQPKWLFGNPQNSLGFLTYGGGPVIQSVLSRSYVQVPVAAFEAGTPVDPTSDVIQMAFVTIGTNPSSGDWVTGSWTTAPGGTYLAQCLVGPGGDKVLAVGQYAIWVKIADSPEVPVSENGVLQVV